MNRVPNIFRVIIIWGALSGIIFPQWASDPTVNNPVSITAGEKVAPKLTDNGAGGTIISWLAQGAHPGEDLIYAQNIDSNGNPLWAAAGVIVSPVTSNYSKENLKIISDGKHGAIVAWYQVNTPGLTRTIKVQRISGDGALLWGNGIDVAQPLPGAEYLVADIATDNNSGVIATWSIFAQSAGQTLRVYAKKIDSTGAVQWNGLINQSSQTSSEAGYPVITSDGLGGAFVAWEDSKNASSVEVYAQYVNYNGDLVWDSSGVWVSSPAHLSVPKCRPQIVCSTSPALVGPIIVWKSSADMAGEPIHGIYAQQLSASSGALLWANAGVHVRITDFPEEPAICSLSNTGVTIAWFDIAVVGNIIFMKAIENGSLVWGSDPVTVCFNGPVNTPGWVDAARKNLALTPSGTNYRGVVATWQDNRNGNWDIYAQYMDQTGAAKWTANGVPVASATDDQTAPSIISSSATASYVTWQDKRNGTENHIFASRIPMLSVPSIVSPADHAVGVTVVPVITWTALSGAASYELDIATDAAFANIIKSETGLTNVTYPVAPYLLTNFTTYHIRVRAVNGTDYSQYASAKFTTILPVIPVLNNPSDGATYYYAQPGFSWSYTTNITGIYSTVQLTTDSNFVAGIVTVAAGNVTNYTWTSNLNLGKKYYWRVFSTNPAGTIISYSAISSFTIFGIATTPVISWPTGGAIVYSNDVTAYWSVLTGSTGLSFNYRYKKVGSANWDTVTSTTNIFATFMNLNPGTAYQYEVQSYNGTDSSAWASETFVTNGTGTLTTPIAAWPVDSAEVYVNSPMVAWYLNANGAGLEYQVGYGLTADTTTFALLPAVSNLYDYLPGLISGQMYHWRVRAINTLGAHSAWSNDGIFTVFGSTTSIKPTLNNPVGGQVVYTNKPTLSWSAGGPGVVSYDVYYKKHSDASFTMLTNTTLPYYVFASDLLAGTVYDWYVVAYNASNAQSGSDTTSFETAGAAGTAIPIAYSPDGGSEVATNHPTLQWFLVTPSVTPFTFQVQVSTEVDFSYIVYSETGITGNSAVVASGLVSGASYYWRVRSNNGAENSAWSNPVCDFVTWAGANPLIVRAGGPAAGMRVNTTSPTLSWYKPTKSVPLTYDLEYGTNADFSNAVVVKDIAALSYRAKNLAPETKYYWRVKSKTAEGLTSEYSNPAQFIPYTVTAVKNTPVNAIITYALSQNYPNPFNPSTVIRYQLPKNGFVALKIYDVFGKEVASLVNEEKISGAYSVSFNGKNMASGVYYYRITIGNFSDTKKLLLLK